MSAILDADFCDFALDDIVAHHPLSRPSLYFQITSISQTGTSVTLRPLRDLGHLYLNGKRGVSWTRPDEWADDLPEIRGLVKNNPLSIYIAGSIKATCTLVKDPQERVVYWTLPPRNGH